jgi:hypothetical protein
MAVSRRALAAMSLQGAGLHLADSVPLAIDVFLIHLAARSLPVVAEPSCQLLSQRFFVRLLRWLFVQNLRPSRGKFQHDLCQFLARQRKRRF